MLQTKTPRRLGSKASHDALEAIAIRSDIARIEATRGLNEDTRSDLGQFLTPFPVAAFMASLFDARKRNIELLDAGAGTGSLTAAFVAELCRRKSPPASISVTAYEVDPFFLGYLRDTMRLCEESCQQVGIAFSSEIRDRDFISDGASMLSGQLFGAAKRDTFTSAILNPPYRKIHRNSSERRLLRKIGVETSNLYTGFLSVVIKLLQPGGELVAITPRSFCNGPYFYPFRRLLLDRTQIRRVHVFESRKKAFRDDNVLQENVIFRAVSEAPRTGRITISSSNSVEDKHISRRAVDYDTVIQPSDPQSFIHLVTDELNEMIARRARRLASSLAGLDVDVSTGRVVDFRARDHLRAHAEQQTVPLVYSTHFENSYISWPRSIRKPEYIVENGETRDLLIPSEVYVVVKRFSAKEERRRIVAALYDPSRVSFDLVGFENHLNYFHRRGRGLPYDLARGLVVYLNSTLVDSYFRQFNGHTQVNATDLRSLRYPSPDQLERLATGFRVEFPSQDEVDGLIGEVLALADQDNGKDPVAIRKKISEAGAALKALGLPPEQQNERSALTLLALLDLKPNSDWKDASDPHRGITEMMNYFEEHFGKRYAPNTRETVRRFTVHQFVQAGLVLANPDKPDRPVNSPKTVYRIEPHALDVVRLLGTDKWEPKVRTYLADAGSLRAQYAAERKLQRIPVRVASNKTVNLTPGGQNELVAKIVDDFCPQFTPGGRMVYVGDAGKKWAYLDEECLGDLRVSVDEHGKFPDVVVLMEDRNWLILIEAVTSHGPVNPKRRRELQELFKNCTAGLVYVTTFLDRKTLTKYIHDIAWETEVWVADSPGHLIHFNGERFLGPYED